MSTKTPFSLTVAGLISAGESEMPSPQEIEEKFWTALKSDMTMMLGLDGVEDGHARPMTAQLDGERGPIWFFTSDVRFFGRFRG